MQKAIVIILILSSYLLQGQILINGDFEDTDLDCEFDISNDRFNSAVSDVKAYGELESLDIINRNCGFGIPQSGSYFVGLEVRTGLTNAIGIESNEFLLPEKWYTLEFWEKTAEFDNNDVRLSVGVSLGARENGDLMFTVQKINTEWTKHTINFSPPIRAKYITILLESAGNALYLIDNFSLICKDFSLGLDQSFCNFNDLSLSGPEAFEDYTWSNGAKTREINVVDPGLYWLEVTREGCTQRDSIIWELDETLCENEDTPVVNCELLLPNIFSPNNDGTNDLWSVVQGQCETNNFKLWIYDKWGNLVFFSQEISQAWDGSFAGQKALPGLYFYTIIYEPLAIKSNIINKGSILLMR